MHVHICVALGMKKNHWSKCHPTKIQPAPEVTIFKLQKKTNPLFAIAEENQKARCSVWGIPQNRCSNVTLPQRNEACTDGTYTAPCYVEVHGEVWRADRAWEKAPERSGRHHEAGTEAGDSLACSPNGPLSWYGTPTLLCKLRSHFIKVGIEL